MSAVQACLQGEASIRRARSLFGDAEPTSAPATAAQSLTDGAETTVAAGQRTSDLSGEGIDAHHQFVDISAPAITTAANNDLILGAHLEAAVAINEAGAAQLDEIAQQARATTQAAASATTPAAQRAVVAVMRTHVLAADDVVKTARSQAADVAAGIRDIDYKQGPPGAGQGDFDLDTQFNRPQGLVGGPGGAPLPASGYECVAGVTAVTLTVVQVTQTKTWWTQPGGSDGQHCK
jgi:hypothetical protein